MADAGSRYRDASQDFDRDERVSMYGTDPVEALRALLKVDPDSEPVDDSEDDRQGKDDEPP